MSAKLGVAAEKSILILNHSVTVSRFDILISHLRAGDIHTNTHARNDGAHVSIALVEPISADILNSVSCLCIQIIFNSAKHPKTEPPYVNVWVECDTTYANGEVVMAQIWTHYII